MIRSRIQTKTKGQDRVDELRARLRGRRGYVTIGLHQGAGQYPDGTDVVEVGLWNEFGTRRNPSRSFLRSAIDEHEEQINRWREEMIDNILNHGWTLEHALEAMGFRIQTLVQNKIRSNVPPPNAPSTVAAKAEKGVAPRTLIDSGLMLRSVTFKVYLE